MDKMSIAVLVEASEIQRFRGYLDAIQDFTISGNHALIFNLFVYDLSLISFQPSYLLSISYPNEEFDSAKLLKRSASEMIEEIESILVQSLRSYGLIRSSNSYVGEYTLSGFWEQLKPCINYESATIYKYTDESKYLQFLFWFKYIIYDPIQGRCLILHGASN